MHSKVKGATHFDCQNINISLFSIKGIAISIRASSANPKRHRKNRQADDEVVRLADIDPKKDPFYELVQRMDREAKDSKGKNFIFENKLKYTKADGVKPD